MGQGSMKNGFLYIILLAILATFLFSTLRQGRETVQTCAHQPDRNRHHRRQG